MKPNKVYVHHRYSNSLFKRIAHNTTNRVFQVEEGKDGVVYCFYQNKPYEFHFVWDFENYGDGINYVNLYQLQKEKEAGDLRGGDITFESQYYLWLNTISKLLERTLSFISKYKGWYIDTIFGEKTIWYDLNSESNTSQLEVFKSTLKSLNQLKNHYILTDNVSLKNQDLPSHIKYSLTSTMFFWNTRTDILLYYEYGKHIHENLNFNYLFNYNIRKHRNRRVKIGELLNKEYTFVSQTDWQDSLELEKNRTKFKEIKGAFYNQLYGGNDFFNPHDSYFISYKVALDMYLRLLPKGKIQILDETFGDSSNFTSLHYIYLSEKTYGLILANIPFIPTSYYILQSIYYILPNCPKYPFDKEIKKHEVSSESFVEFVDTFYENQIEYLPLLEKWTEKVHKLLINKLENTNSFLDLIVKNVNNPQKTPLI